MRGSPRSNRGAAAAYVAAVGQQLRELLELNLEPIETAATWVAQAVAADHLVWVSGSGHAGLLAEETFFRAGSLAAVTPLRVPGLSTEVVPITLTSSREREDGYAEQHLSAAVGPGDVVFVHSVSGRNAAPVEIAAWARAKGARTIAVTSLAFASATTARNRSRHHLHEVADLVIDSMVPIGDAILILDDGTRTGPVSTILGATILHAVFARAAEQLAAMGIQPPVYRSSNLDGGDDRNAVLLRRYRGRVAYL